ncbi:hypothetical protein PO909_009816 [Leuciscus waleckii]
MLQPTPPPPPDQPVPQGPYAQGPYPGQSVVTVRRTVFVTAAPQANPVPDYLCYSIFTMLCCCLPLGFAALVYSWSARDANISGQQALAEKNSKMARTLNHVAFAIGLVVTVFVIVYQVFFKNNNY